MKKMRVVLDLDEDLWNSLPAVAEHLSLPIREPSAGLCRMILEHAVTEILFDAGAPLPTTELPSSEEALAELLDPNVSKPLSIAKVAHLLGDTTGKTPGEWFDDFAAADPQDVWVNAVLAKTEDQPIWKLALVTTYGAITGRDRHQASTWTLIERTFHLLKRDEAGLSSLK